MFSAFGGTGVQALALLEDEDASGIATASDRVTLYWRALDPGRLELLRRLLEVGASFSAATSMTKQTLLSSAAANGDDEGVELLLGRGADPNDAGEDGGEPPLVWAADGNFGNQPNRWPLRDPTRTIELLIASGASPSKALIVAADRGNEVLVRRLLDAGAALDAVEAFAPQTVSFAPYLSDRTSALHRAVAKGHQHIVKLLLEKGASTTMRDGRGKTARFYSPDLKMTKLVGQ